jgi:hypothetical protein
VALGCATAACTTVVVPPLSPAHPLPVFILDHGRHASLVVSRDDGTVVRYSYGDWRYYARRQTGVLRGSSAIFWPTRAGLGRRALGGPPDTAAVRLHVRVGIEHLHTVMVGAEAIRRLTGRLDSLFAANAASHVYNAAYDLDFVSHPRAYWAFNNSNQVVARWLRELGATVRGAALVSRWRVEHPHTRGLTAREQE